jgi:microcystin-dependent protein
MGQPFVGEIRIFAGNFNPNGWMFCDGALLPISEYETLFNLIGTTYGGDGQSTFGLPDLRGRVPIHMGTGAGSTYQIGQNGGVESVTISTQQLPIHSHTLPAASTNQSASPSGAAMLAQATSAQTGIRVFSTAAPGTNLVPSTISQATGGSQPHDNRQPYQCVNFIISLFGIFPSPT